MKEHKSYQILRRLVDRTIPTQYRPKVRAWLLSDQDAEEKDEAMHRIWSETEAEADESTMRSFHKLLLMISQENKDKSLSPLRRVLRYAAILLMPVIAGTAVWFYAKSHMTTQKVAEMVECYVPYGQQRMLTLPDGSQIKANAGTLIVYPKEFAENTRNIYLSGEAYFSVTKNPDKPFIVSTGQLKVKVLGTQFNIEAYPEEKRVTTTLEQGSVQVFPTAKTDKAVVIAPNEQVVYDKNSGQMSVSLVKATDYSEWVHGIIRFDNQPLREIIASLERSYNVDIKTSPEVRTSDLYTMRFKKSESIDKVMNIFTQLLGNVKYRIEGNEVLLYKTGKEVHR